MKIFVTIYHCLCSAELAYIELLGVNFPKGVEQIENLTNEGLVDLLLYI